MTESLPEFRLGIIGGCMSHQNGTPHNSLYHRVLGEMLRAQPGVRLRVSIARNFGADLLGRLDSLLDSTPVDGVLVHMRAADMVWPSRPIRRVWRDGRLHSELNLELRSRRDRAPNPQPDDPGSRAYGPGPDLQDTPIGGRQIARFRVRNLNLVAGTLLGMDRRALGRLFGELDEFERACRKRNIPFFVLGPTPTIYSAWADRIVRNGNVSIQRRFAESDVPYALIEARYDADGKSLLRADGTHLSIEGQRFVGELLYRSGMPEWMTAILARRDAASV